MIPDCTTTESALVRPTTIEDEYEKRNSNTQPPSLLCEKVQENFDPKLETEFQDNGKKNFTSSQGHTIVAVFFGKSCGTATPQ